MANQNAPIAVGLMGTVSPPPSTLFPLRRREPELMVGRVYYRYHPLWTIEIRQKGEPHHCTTV